MKWHVIRLCISTHNTHEHIACVQNQVMHCSMRSLCLTQERSHNCSVLLLTRLLHIATKWAAKRIVLQAAERHIYMFDRQSRFVWMGNVTFFLSPCNMLDGLHCWDFSIGSIAQKSESCTQQDFTQSKKKNKYWLSFSGHGLIRQFPISDGRSVSGVGLLSHQRGKHKERGKRLPFIWPTICSIIHPSLLRLASIRIG